MKVKSFDPFGLLKDHSWAFLGGAGSGPGIFFSKCVEGGPLQSIVMSGGTWGPYK